MKLKHDLAFVDLDDEVIAVPMDDTSDKRRVIRLNETGKSILVALKEDMTENQLIELIAGQYEGDRDLIRTSVLSFVAKLKENDLI